MSIDYSSEDGYYILNIIINRMFNRVETREKYCATMHSHYSVNYSKIPNHPPANTTPYRKARNR